MIQGRFGGNGQIYFEIELITSDGLSFSTEATLDTGFTEYIAISQQDLESLDWTFLRKEELRTAQGEATFDIYLGKIAIATQEFEVPVFAGDEIREILLGYQWLKTFTLMVNFQENRVSLSR